MVSFISVVSNVHIRFEVEYITLNSAKIRKLEIGKGIKVEEVVLNYHIDKVLFNREVDSVFILSPVLNLMGITEDFSRGKSSDIRKKPNFPGVKVAKVMVEDLTFYPMDTFDIWLRYGEFSYSMGGRLLKLDRVNLFTVDIPGITMFLDSIGASMYFNGESISIFVKNAEGMLDTINTSLTNSLIDIPLDSKTTTVFIRGYFAKFGSVYGKDVSAVWKISKGLGNIGFKSGETGFNGMKIKNLRFKANLENAPSIKIYDAYGEVFGGKVWAEIYVDSLRSMKGNLRALSISPIEGVLISGTTKFKLDKDGLYLDGYVEKFKYLEPSFGVDNFNFHVSSEDMTGFNYDIEGNFISLKGWYNVRTQDFYSKFALNKPTKLINIGNLRIYTFDGKGEIGKLGDSLNVYLEDARLWYVVSGKVRMDLISLRDFTIKTSFERPGIENTSLSGHFKLISTLKDSLEVGGFIKYGDKEIQSSISLRHKSLGEVFARLNGTIMDTNNFALMIDTLAYSYKDTVDIILKNVSLSVDSERVHIFLPSNRILKGDISGEFSLNRLNDSVGGNLSLRNVSVIRVLPLIFPDGRLYLDTINARLEFAGTVKDPEVIGKIKTSSVMFGDAFVDSTDLNVRLRKDWFTVEDSRLWLMGSALNIEVFKIFFKNRVIYGHLYTTNLNTDNLLPFILPENSKANFDIFVSGTVDTPSTFGYIFWEAKAININNNIIRNPKIYAILSSEKIILISRNDTNVLRVGDGRVSVDGVLRTNMDVDSLNINLDNTFINIDTDVSARISGNLKITGNLSKKVVIKGDIVSREFFFSKPLSELIVQSPPKNQKPLILYDIHFSAPRRLFINSPIYSQAFSAAVMEIDAEMMADMTLQKFYETSNITYGYLEIISGNVYLLDKVFNIDNGRIELYGTEGSVNINSSSTLLKPSLQNDTSLAGSLDSVKVFISITGDIYKPKVEIWSQPYMTTGDIVSLIFGRQGALISAIVGTGLRKGLKVQDFSMRNTGDVSRLIFGTYLGKNLYIRYLSNSVGQTNYNSLRTQYFINNNLSIYGERIEDENEKKYGVGINFRIRF